MASGVTKFEVKAAICMCHFTGGYVSGREPASYIRDSIVELCNELKDDAIALVDVVAPPDFILSSPIGSSNGEVCLVVY